MKKIFCIFIALLMIFSLNFSKVTAESSDVVESNVPAITDMDGLLLSDNSYIVDPLRLIGTTFEGEIVIVRDDGVYINNVRSNEGIKISIGDKVIGWLIEGAIMYVTGYSGAKVAEKTISMIVSFVSSRPDVVIIAILLFTLTGDTVQAYETADGNECILSPSGGYVCKYSL